LKTNIPLNRMKRRKLYITQDCIAMRIAARYRMTREYNTARRNELKPLEDWDLISSEELVLFR
jgi:hypothetical protein